MKKVAILQSSYIPWKGYFDMIAAVDRFILYDDVQYTRRDWRNRNKIKTPQGLKWLTIPVKVKGKYHQTIRETEVDGDDWRQLHWDTIRQCYRRAPHFSEVAAFLEPLYLDRKNTHLSLINRRFIEAVCAFLGITTPIDDCSDFELAVGRTERLLSICVQAGAAEYISGPAAQSYLDTGLFSEAGIGVSWFGYDGYPEYPQLWGEFEHTVSILDLLFNCGREATRYMKHAGVR